MNIEEWLTEYAPNVLNIYKQSLIPFSDIKAGTKCIYIKPGYNTGIKLEFSGEIEDLVINGKLSRSREVSNSNSKWILEENSVREGPWYFKVYILTDEQYKNITEKFTVKQRRDWERELFGKPLRDYSDFQSIRGWDR